MIPGKRKRERDLKKLSIPSAIRFLDKENCLREADRILAVTLRSEGFALTCSGS
jgi:hypothetical protein